MSITNFDSSIQTTSGSVNLTPINKKSTLDLKRRKTPYQTQKEIFLRRKDMIESMQNLPKSVSPKRRRLDYQEDKVAIEVLSTGLNPINIKKKKVTFKGNLVQVIKVISYKKYYIEEAKSEHNGKCSCFIF